jgi:hypothetical protein
MVARYGCELRHQVLDDVTRARPFHVENLVPHRLQLLLDVRGHLDFLLTLLIVFHTLIQLLQLNGNLLVCVVQGYLFDLGLLWTSMVESYDLLLLLSLQWLEIDGSLHLCEFIVEDAL